MIDMKKHKIEEYEKLDMVRALISARIDYYQQKKGDKTFHQYILEEQECINSVVYAGLNYFLRKVVNKTLDTEQSMAEPKREFWLKLHTNFFQRKDIKRLSKIDGDNT